METRQGNLYDYPRYYDLVFGADWKAEFDFLHECFELHVDGRVSRLFEPACGTGRLMYRLAREGFDIVGLDLNEHAVEYCNRRLSSKGLTAASSFVGDMSDFRLPAPVDAAFNMINSFRHLQTEAEATGHLNCVRDALRVGGVYVMGMHLIPEVGESGESESWSARRGHLCVNTRLWRVGLDLHERQEWVRMRYEVFTPTKSFALEDEFPFRTYRQQQFHQLVEEIDGLEIAETYDFLYRIDRPIDIGPETEDVVYVLKRTAL